MLGVGPKETAIWTKAIGRGHLCTLDTCLVLSVVVAVVV